VIDELALILVRGIGLGAIFALLALSLNVIYNATHILNFAQGAMFVLGGLLGIVLPTGGYGSLTWGLMMLASAGALALLMALQGWVTLWPLRQSTQQFSWLITTLAVSIIISALLFLTQGPWSSQYTGPVPWFTVQGMRTPMPYLALPLLALAWYLALRWFSRRTLTGLALSALSQDLEAAAAAGLKVKRLQILSFVISGLITGSAGFAAAPIISVTPDAGIRYVIAGFVAAVVGGMGSMIGAIVAGPLIGAVAMYAIYTFGGKYEGFVSLVILSLMLFIRPSGIFGSGSARRV
jgi:branched-chain amino acid transport system permease protein